MGSGRTDTGVHAISQVAHFDYDKPIDNSFLYRINSFLSSDISINSIKKVKENISARFDAISREYIYKIHCVKSPFLNDRSLFYPKEINVSLINDACKVLIDQSDFKTFSKVKTDVNNYNCQISRAEIKKEGYNYYFTISSDRFLRGMVRAIMGTMIQINEEKLSVESLEDIILKKTGSMLVLLFLRMVYISAMFYMIKRYTMSNKNISGNLFDLKILNRLFIFCKPYMGVFMS